MSIRRHKNYGKRLKKSNTNSIKGSRHSKSFNRKYVDGLIIHPNLPKAYGLPPEKLKEQRCSNCKFMTVNGNCTKWSAPVRDKFWCKSWQQES